MWWADMKISELWDIIYTEAVSAGDDEPKTLVTSMMIVFGLVRTATQGEPSTIDGEFSSMSVYVKNFGQPKIDHVLKLFAGIFDLEIPDRIIIDYLDAQDKDDQNELI